MKLSCKLELVTENQKYLEKLIVYGYYLSIDVHCVKKELKE
ncbi:uncharacterized protein METZ01_LOCUS108567 [marine metagenome]|jgi:hypothetical protein|uniref:Uncharacterized protein n=1 Tax=marine metagenome TaxID=408172 RepID=A0A381WUU7_9ZZZZ|tara:strand:- start:1196 stop:1318 length:123 start_codon:yes stop_codon:yes gene_type:complete